MTSPTTVHDPMDRYLEHAEACVVATLTGEPAQALAHAHVAFAAYAEAAGSRAVQLRQAAEGGRLLEALALVDPDDRPDRVA